MTKEAAAESNEQRFSAVLLKLEQRLASLETKVDSISQGSKESGGADRSANWRSEERSSKSQVG